MYLKASGGKSAKYFNSLPLRWCQKHSGPYRSCMIQSFFRLHVPVPLVFGDCCNLPSSLTFFFFFFFPFKVHNLASCQLRLCSLSSRRLLSHLGRHQNAPRCQSPPLHWGEWMQPCARCPCRCAMEQTPPKQPHHCKPRRSPLGTARVGRCCTAARSLGTMPPWGWFFLPQRPPYSFHPSPSSALSGIEATGGAQLCVSIVPSLQQGHHLDQ